MPEAIPDQSAAQHKRGQRRGLLASISAICIVALLASGSYLIFNVLNSHTEGDVARVIPSETVALVSVDLIAAAAHGQHLTTGNLGNASSQGDTFKLLTGLEWDKDILPWVGRDIAIAAFQRQPPYHSPNGGQGASPTKVNDTIGGAFLLQSRDDGAAQAAIRKAAKHQESLGLTLATLDYHGLTLYHASLLQGDESGTTLAAGKGWAIVAGDLPAAREIVDRLTGNSSDSDTLAQNSAYRDAIGTLPANRFGTLFLNVRALVKGFIYSSPAQTDVVSALANTYPTAVGYLTWTSLGLRAQFTFPAAHKIDVGSLTGDTTTLASLTPANAFAYTGIANLGRMLRAQTALTTPSNASSGAAPSFFGLLPADPALQQPAALSVIGEPTGATGFLALLNAPDQADALAVTRQIAENQHLTSQPATVAGVAVTAYYAKLPPTQSALSATNLATDAETPGIASVRGGRLVGIGTWLDNTLVLASDPTAMTDAIHTIRDHAPNLGQDTRFQQVINAAPSDRSAITFLDLSRAATTGNATTSVLAAGLAQRIQALVLTQVWSDSRYQTTADILLPK